MTGGLWALDAALAHQRQFPAVDWETSYSLYTEVTGRWFAANVGADWPALRRDTLELLQRERELREIAGLIGPEALQDEDRLILDSAHTMRELVLGQNAYDPNDAISSVEKTYRLAVLARDLFRAARGLLLAGTSFDDLDLRSARHALAAVRSAPYAEVEARALEAAAVIAALGGLGTSPGGDPTDGTCWHRAR